MNYGNEIRAMVSMPALADRYGFKPNRAGFICCPFHHEKTPSLKVYEGDRGWHCFGCGRSGSVIDFAMLLFDLNFQQASEKINMDFSLGLPIGQRLTLRQKRGAERMQKVLRAAYDAWYNEEEALKKAYEKAYQEWAACMHDLKEFAPTDPSEDFHPRFVAAVNMRDNAWNALIIAEERLSEHADKRYNDCHAQEG